MFRKHTSKLATRVEVLQRTNERKKRLEDNIPKLQQDLYPHGVPRSKVPFECPAWDHMCTVADLAVNITLAVGSSGSLT